jgi:hypothetical protein
MYTVETYSLTSSGIRETFLKGRIFDKLDFTEILPQMKPAKYG